MNEKRAHKTFGEGVALNLVQFSYSLGFLNSKGLTGGGYEPVNPQIRSWGKAVVEDEEEEINDNWKRRWRMRRANGKNAIIINTHFNERHQQIITNLLPW